jgi:hypothetical protein
MAWDSDFILTNDEWEVLRHMRAFKSGKLGPKGGEAYQQALAAIMERPSLPKIPAEEDTRLDPGSGTEENGREVERPSLPKILAEEDTRPERPSLQKIPAEEDTRLDPGSGTEEAGREERPSLPKIPAEEDTRLDPGSGTEEDEEDTRLDPGSGTEEADKPYTRLDPVSGAKKVYDVEKEADEAIEVGRKMLRRWAADHGMPDALKRQRVLALLASAEGIFPDQAVASNRVLHCIQDEVHIILAVRAAREEAEEEAGSSGTEEETEEEEAEEEDEWDFEDFGDYEDSSDDEECDDEEEESEGKAEEEAEEEAGSSAPEEEAVKEEERPSLSKIPAEEEGVKAKQKGVKTTGKSDIKAGCLRKCGALICSFTSENPWSL